MREWLSEADAHELLRRQQNLQLEAGRIIRDLDLPNILAPLGHVEHIGSSASGLMVWRDIDLGGRCREPTLRRVWKIDLSLWSSDEPRGQVEHIADLQHRLAEETRLAILWVKEVWHKLPVYPYEVGGADVYDGILGHKVRTPAEFDAYLRERGMPSHGGDR